MIVPVFIPHWGCPHRCIFCEQERITSQRQWAPLPEHVVEVIETAQKSKRFTTNRTREVAFYGGTFTGLPIERMRALLEAVSPYLNRGVFHSVRVSTRPDGLDEDRLELMRNLGVGAVELGVQSMDDRVLRLARRGHSSQQTIRAVARLKQFGFRVGVQLMPGLPGGAPEEFRRTVERVVRLKPDMARLYPVVVIRGTPLARWYASGRYVPLSLTEAVDLCAEGCIHLESQGVPVIRMGLMSSPALLNPGQVVAGPWHPAFGFLVRSRIYHRNLALQLPPRGRARRIALRAPSQEISLLRGYQNQGIDSIEQQTGAKVVAVVADNRIPTGQVVSAIS